MDQKKKIIIGHFARFIAAQALRPTKNNGSPDGPKDITSIVPVPDSVLLVLKKSCYDCHSNYTSYPWYYQITPVNWWLAYHVNDGRRQLNFTRFGDFTPKKMDKKLTEVEKTVKKGQMPLNSYLWMHGNAKLNDTQRQMIIDWVASARTHLPK